MNKFLGQNTQDLDEIKQHNIKLNEDERSSTNNKNKNDELNNILSVIDRIYKFFEYRFLPGEQPDESNLPKWIKVSKQKFDVIKKKVQNAETSNLKARPKVGKVININKSNKLIDEIEYSQITYEEATLIILLVRRVST